MFLKSLLTSLFQREELGSLVFLLGLFCINPSFATTSHNIYDAKGNMIASCGEKGCEYFIYQAVSRTGVVKNNQFTHQANGLDGKTGEITHDQAGVKNSQLWVPDFHGSVIAKLTTEKTETILFDAFGAVLNEEDCQDYHYTDKPRIGCTKLHNFNARFYDPKIGRFITSDPVEQYNLNWFVYVNNNPLSFIDPTGMAELTPEQKEKYENLLKTERLAFAVLQAQRYREAQRVRRLQQQGRRVDRDMIQELVTEQLEGHFKTIQGLVDDYEKALREAGHTQEEINDVPGSVGRSGGNVINLAGRRRRDPNSSSMSSTDMDVKKIPGFIPEFSEVLNKTICSMGRTALNSLRGLLSIPGYGSIKFPKQNLRGYGIGTPPEKYNKYMGTIPGRSADTLPPPLPIIRVLAMP